MTKELRSLYGALLAESQGRSGLSRTGVTLSLSGVATNKCAIACVCGRFKTVFPHLIFYIRLHICFHSTLSTEEVKTRITEVTFIDE